MVIHPKIHYYFWQKSTLIRPTEHVAEHEYSCYCHIKQACVIIRNEKKLKKCYTRFVAMEIGMCIRHIDSATDEIELWACDHQMLSISFPQIYPLRKRFWTPSLDKQTLIPAINNSTTIRFSETVFFRDFSLLILILSE